MKKQISQACVDMAGNGVATTNKPTHSLFNHEILGHVLGPAKGDGNKMAQWVLKANCRVVPHHTLCPLNLQRSRVQLNIRNMIPSMN